MYYAQLAVDTVGDGRRGTNSHDPHSVRKSSPRQCMELTEPPRTDQQVSKSPSHLLFSVQLTSFIQVLGAMAAIDFPSHRRSCIGVSGIAIGRIGLKIDAGRSAMTVPRVGSSVIVPTCGRVWMGGWDEVN